MRKASCSLWSDLLPLLKGCCSLVFISGNLFLMLSVGGFKSAKGIWQNIEKCSWIKMLKDHCRGRQLSTNLLLLSSQEWETRHLYVTLFSSKKPFWVPLSMFGGHSKVLKFAPSQASGKKKYNKSFCESLSSTAHNRSLWSGTLFRQILLQGCYSTDCSLLRF